MYVLSRDALSVLCPNRTTTEHLQLCLDGMHMHCIHDICDCDSSTVASGPAIYTYL